MANNQEQIKELTERLEEGVKAVFESDKYGEYLRVMSKFYNYSYRNTLLIALQKPDATMVAGYEAWKKKFGRHVNKGEKAIKILAPAPYRTKKEMEVIDQVTQMPVRCEDGSIMTEEVEVTIPAFRVANVYDVSQTSGRPLPSLFDNIEGDVKGFERFYRAVESVSPVPMGFEPMADKDGYYHQIDKRIALREGMSERQTAAAAIHEISHATLHALDMEHLKESLKQRGKDQKTMEVEAESIAYVVCQRYGIETGENSFGYIAMWSKDKSLPELQASLKVIRDTASDIIVRIDEKLAEMEREEMRGIADEREKEEELLSGEGNRYGIYQIVDGTRADDFQFMGMDAFDKQGIPVLREDYQLVYSGILGEEDSLDSIFEKFNLDRPEDFRGHSISVSDIVLLHEDGRNTAHFVDSFGFREVPDFLNLSVERVYTLLSGEKEEKYLLIQKSDEGLDYSFYDTEYHLLDGGIITNADQPMENAIRDILGGAGLQISGRVTDVDAFLERGGEAEKAKINEAVHRRENPDSKTTVSESKVQDDGKSSKSASEDKEEIADILADQGKASSLPHIEFYVAECEDVHDIGEYCTYPDIQSAVNKYKEILDDPRRRYLGNGMGIVYHREDNDVYNNSECCLVSGRVVCGNVLDSLPGLGEKQEVREALSALHDAFPDFRYKMPKYEKESDTVQMSAEDLAVRLDRLAHDFDPYHYQDCLAGQDNLVQEITYNLYTGGTKHYLSQLNDVIGEGGSLATEANKLKEQLTAFEPVVPIGKEPVVRVDFCDSKDFTFQKYMSIGAFDDTVAEMNRVLSRRNTGKDEHNIETSSIRFIVYFPDDGKMQRLKDTIEIGLGNGGFISAYKMQTEYKLTDENWLAYKRGQGQASYDSFVSVLTNIKDNVLPYLQTFCNGQERATVSVETAQTVTMGAGNKKQAEKVSSSESDRKVGRSTNQTASLGGRKSIHERLASNKARIETQPGKGNPVKGVERA